VRPSLERNIRLEDGGDAELFDAPFVDTLKYLHDRESDDLIVADTQGTVNSEYLKRYWEGC
jgi:hypothetical protein